jgi:hypothetical protein
LVFKVSGSGGANDASSNIPTVAKRKIKGFLNVKKKVLGMPKANKWVLAMSFVDTSYLRNQLSFEMYRRLGAWAPRTKYVNFVMQGQYVGLYSMGERKRRLDLIYEYSLTH